MTFLPVDPQVATVLIATLALLVASLTYALNRSNRKSSFPNLQVEWKTPTVLTLEYANSEHSDRCIFFEALITNSGGRSATLVEMKPDEDYFVRYLRLVQGEKTRNEPYDRPYQFFSLEKPVSEYLSADAVDSIANATELHTKRHPSISEVPLDVAVDPGKSVRFSLCFFFPEYQRRQDTGYTMILGIKLLFNNGQESSRNLAPHGEITIAKRGA